MGRRENQPTTEPGKPIPAGARMRIARRKAGLTLDALAARLGYTKPYLSSVENSRHRPSQAIVNAYASALSLRPEELDPEGDLELRPNETSDASAVLDGAVDRIALDFNLSPNELDMLRDLLIEDAREKARTIRESLDLWRTPGPVPVCCIPVAGWQWREWPFEQIVAAVAHASEEAMQARIRELVLILPPEKIPEMERALRRPPFAERLQKITCVPQPAALGLGHALLQARALIGPRPFALLLPDDRFEHLGAAPVVLRNLVEQYAAGVDHLVAVAKLKSSGRQYGVARLSSGHGRGGNRAVELLVEKPDVTHPVFQRDQVHDTGATYAVVGRYILSPSIMTALAAEGRDLEPGAKIELLDALQRLIDREHESVAAYVLPSLVQLERDQTVFVASAPQKPTGSSHVA